jgi:rhodanese-related sulfurtransferase
VQPTSSGGTPAMTGGQSTGAAAVGASGTGGVAFTTGGQRPAATNSAGQAMGGAARGGSASGGLSGATGGARPITGGAPTTTGGQSAGGAARGGAASGGLSQATGGQGPTTGGAPTGAGGRSTGGTTALAGQSAGGQSSDAGTDALPPQTPITVNGPTAQALVAAGAVLIDVRTASDFNQAHLTGAINIPLEDLPARLSELDPSVPVVVYCNSGSRSRQAAAQLGAAGFVVYDLGAMANWGA